MRTDVIVLSEPLVDDDLGLLEGLEDLAVEQLAPEASIEARSVAV